MNATLTNEHGAKAIASPHVLIPFDQTPWSVTNTIANQSVRAGFRETPSESLRARGLVKTP